MRRIMGNYCFGSHADDESHNPKSTFVNPTSSVLVTPGTSRGYSNGAGMLISSNISYESGVSGVESSDIVLNGEILPTPNLKEYNFDEIRSAKRNFRSDLVLGVGGFGTMFKGNASTEPLSWEAGLNIAIGAARGLTFLHGLEEKISYRDFKGSNILLDGNYNAKIAAFGLAKLGPTGGDLHVSTRVMGTQGYAAPEYVATGHLYVKSDVYGFGVVLLEILTGLRERLWKF